VHQTLNGHLYSPTVVASDVTCQYPSRISSLSTCIARNSSGGGGSWAS